MNSRHNLEPENTGRAHEGRLKQMTVQQTTEVINNGCTHGNSVEILQQDEDNRELSQVNDLHL